MWAATRMGAPEAPVAIAAVMSDGQTPDAVREAARDCLLSTKGKVVADLAAAAVQDGLPAGQVDALSILSERRATDKADIVLAATGSNNAEVATAAYAALQNVVGTRQLAALYPLVGIGRRCTPAAGPAGGDRCLGRGFRGRSRWRRSKRRWPAAVMRLPRYYVVLAATGSPEALQIITDGFESGDAAAKEQALTALLSWKGLGATDELYKIAKAGDAAYAARRWTALSAVWPRPA